MEEWKVVGMGYMEGEGGKGGGRAQGGCSVFGKGCVVDGGKGVGMF